MHTSTTYPTAILADTADTLAAARMWRRVLVVMPGYMASPHSQGAGAGSALLTLLGRLWRALTRERYRTQVRVYRDYYANPRRAAYMTARVFELLTANCPEAVAIVVGTDLGVDRTADTMLSAARIVVTDTAAGSNPVARTVALAAAVRPLAAAEAFDAGLLVFPDAIGLGQEPVERLLDGLFPGRVHALTGRRRLCRLDARQRRRLCLRRFLAETRLIEVALAALLAIQTTLPAWRERHSGSQSETTR